MNAINPKKISTQKKNFRGENPYNAIVKSARLIRFKIVKLKLETLVV